MKENLYRNNGYALAVGILLMGITIVLHPVGGDINHLIRISDMIIISHAIGILSIPFSLVGYWGITKKLGSESFFSLTAFSLAAMAMLAALLAASINGLALPFFVQDYGEANEAELQTVKQILDYSFSLNHAFDYIFIIGITLATAFWSIQILKTGKFPKWLGYLGLLLGAILVISLFMGHRLVHLHEFRIFVMGVIIWSILSAYLMIVKNKD